jgi:RNA polymerase sigma-70 factor (ECF subfamily)
MVALSEGDRSAFDRVFTMLWPILRSVSQRMLGDRTDADDAAQQALYKLFARAWRFDPRRDALPWALTFVINECRTLRNRYERRGVTRLRAMEEPDGAAASAESQLIERELLVALHSAAAGLDAKDRRALGLEPASEAVAGPTHRKRKQRALSRLRLAWSKLYGAN